MSARRDPRSAPQVESANRRQRARAGTSRLPPAAAPVPETDIHPLRDDILEFMKEHPDTPPGLMGTVLLVAVRRARLARPDLTDQDFFHLAASGPLSWHEGSMVEEILDHVAAVRPAPRPRRPGGAPRLPEDQVRRELETAIGRCRARGDERPTSEAIAAAHSPVIEPRTLRKRLERYPHLRDLIRH